MNLDPISKVRGLASGCWAALAGLNSLLAFANVYLAAPFGWDAPLLRPIPGVAILVIETRTLWFLVSLVLPVMALLAIFFGRDDRRVFVTLRLILPAIAIQACLTSIALFRLVFPPPFEGFWSPLKEQSRVLYELIAGDGLSAWVIDFRSLLGVLGFAIAMFLFWRYITAKDLREFPN
jgi:hypothetical protein